MLVLSLAKLVKTRLSLGANIILYQLKITDYGTAHASGLSASMRYIINDNWDWVTTVRNINSPKLGSSKDELPQVVTTGFIGTLYEILTIATEGNKTLNIKEHLSLELC